MIKTKVFTHVVGFAATTEEAEKSKKYRQSNINPNGLEDYGKFFLFDKEINEFMDNKNVIEIIPNISQNTEGNWLGGYCWITVSYIIKYEEKI